MSPTSDEKAKAHSSTQNKEDLEGEHNEWKFRVPYKVHENDKNFKALYEGSCHCGRVQYQLSREKPLDAKFCHCSTCQTLHGAPFHLIKFKDKKEKHNFDPTPPEAIKKRKREVEEKEKEDEEGKSEKK
ncbi:hypothetical protein M7I_4583 [Glarea lozoyensis 74030]|uniref:CENP-V/GFA domain-containing protein n=1 Tax=Glarea lozoyensis (strain ATCC 74030 / MF5533) TaxID=1104152 RepID=H0EPK2_GLAL7|nr:hypothetical protein M7I_4583 [Glarea lozoyensis 74030]